MSDRLERLQRALDFEQKHEEAYFRELNKTKAFRDRIEAGVMWYPVSVDKVHYSIAEKIEIEVSPARLSSSGDKNTFREGSSAVFFVQGEERKEFKGTISHASRKRIRMIIGSDMITKEDVARMSNCGIERIYDDRPYRVMKESIRLLKKSKEPHIVDLREGVRDRSLSQHGQEVPKFKNDNAILNDSQINAIEKCSAVERMGIIHGPPGTGKTTTLVSLINHLTKFEKKILVCAPSNNAVDLLARRLNENGNDVLRVGNVTRIGDSIAHLCLEEKVRSHKDWQHIKQVKIEAEAARTEASRYKRKFGPQQKRDRRAFQQEARELQKWARELESRLTNHVIRSTRIICTTLIGCAHPNLDDWQFDTLIIDEASQALEPECWTAMLKAKRTIMAGDHKQLPPTVKSKEAEELGLSTTILDLMTNEIKETFLLNIQYRMHEKILAFSNKHFYDGQLVSAEFVKFRSLPQDDEIITFIDTSGCGFEEVLGTEDKSYTNPGEYFMIREHLLSFSSLIDPKHTIGIISPYARQVGYIRQEVEKDDMMKGLNIEVNSIDGFQGQEKDIIYISLVRSNDFGNIGFLKDYRRLNVALTRARFKMIIIGDMSTLGHDPIYMALADHMEKNGVYKSGWEYMS